MVGLSIDNCDKMASKDSATKAGDGEVLQFSLTDPDHLSAQLDSANLDDEETEILISEAMKLNAHLKDVLRQQQFEERSNSVSCNSKKLFIGCYTITNVFVVLVLPFFFMPIPLRTNNDLIAMLVQQ